MKKDERLTEAGDEIVGALQDFLDAIQGDGAVAERFTIRTVELDLKPRVYTGEDVQKIRKILNLSQALFGRFLGVSAQLVRAWERGDRKPSDMACRFLDEIAHSPEHWKVRLRDSLLVKTPQRAAKAKKTLES